MIKIFALHCKEFNQTINTLHLEPEISSKQTCRDAVIVVCGLSGGCHRFFLIYTQISNQKCIYTADSEGGQ